MDDLLVAQAEDVLNIVETFILTNRVIDSVESLISKGELEYQIGDVHLN